MDWLGDLDMGCLHAMHMRGEAGEVFPVLDTVARRVEDLQESRSGFRHAVAARMMWSGVAVTSRGIKSFVKITVPSVG